MQHDYQRTFQELIALLVICTVNVDDRTCKYSGQFVSNYYKIVVKYSRHWRLNILEKNIFLINVFQKMY